MEDIWDFQEKKEPLGKHVYQAGRGKQNSRPWPPMAWTHPQHSGQSLDLGGFLLWEKWCKDMWESDKGHIGLLIFVIASLSISVSPLLGCRPLGTNENHRASNRTWGGGWHQSGLGPEVRWPAFPTHTPPTLRGSQQRDKARKLLERIHVTLSLWLNTPTDTELRSRLSPWGRWAHGVDCSCFCRPSTRPVKAETVTLLYSFPAYMKPMVMIVTATSDSYHGLSWQQNGNSPPRAMWKRAKAQPDSSPTLQGTQSSAILSFHFPRPPLLTLFSDFQECPESRSFNISHCCWYFSFSSKIVINLFFENKISVTSLVWLGGR